MKRIFALLLILNASTLCADYDLDDASAVEMIDTEELEKGAFTLKGSYDGLGKAKVKREDDRRGHITYAHAEADFEAVVSYNPCCKEGVIIGLGYEYTRLDWNKNHFFKKKNYNTATLSAVFFTNRPCNWHLVASANINIDANNWDLNDYATYDFLLWGRYQYNCAIGLHAGVYVETGMKLDRVLPILGFDCQINDKVLLSLVYPLNVSLSYKLNCRWSIAVAGRLFSDRHRAGRRGLFHKAIWRYTNTGAEIALNYNLHERLTANIHAGYAFGGTLRIANRHNHHSHRVKFDGSPYAGVSLSLNF